MENASKALIMAGSILIALVIVSLGILVFNNFANKAKDNTSFTEQEIASINNKITPYLGENISGSQVNVLIETIRSINQNQIQKTDSGVIEIEFPEGKLEKNNTYKNNNHKVTTGKYYNVSVDYASSGYINKVSVTLQ